MFYANTTISIASAATQDPRGNRTALTPEQWQQEGIPASLIEQTQLTSNPVDGTPRDVRYITMRVMRGTVIAKTNRVRDEKTGDIFVVESVVAPTTHFPVNFGVIVKLRRVGAA